MKRTSVCVPPRCRPVPPPPASCPSYPRHSPPPCRLPRCSLHRRRSPLRRSRPTRQPQRQPSRRCQTPTYLTTTSRRPSQQVSEQRLGCMQQAASRALLQLLQLAPKWHPSLSACCLWLCCSKSCRVWCMAWCSVWPSQPSARLPPAIACAEPAPASGGWDLDFLKKNQAAGGGRAASMSACLLGVHPQRLLRRSCSHHACFAHFANRRCPSL